MVILAVSDVHLGYSRSNVDLFNDFLKDTIDREDVDKLVILGDFFDMWRRDVSGLFLEHHDILHNIIELNRKEKLCCIAGNHDYHLLKLKGHDYPIEFKSEWKDPENRYFFQHGWEFDAKQEPSVMEILCHNLSDKAGDLRSDFWDLITCKKDVSKTLKELIYKNRENRNSFFNFKIEKEKFLKNLLTSPRERLAFSFGSVECEALQKSKHLDNQILVFGHTHRPFVGSDQKIVNTGSWVSDEEVFNTYVELDGKRIKLMKYPEEDITQEMTK